MKQTLAEDEVYEIHVGDGAAFNAERHQSHDETAAKFVEYFLTSKSLAESGLILTRVDDHNYVVTPESKKG